MASLEDNPVQNYTDEDITFFMGFYNDRVRADGALTRLRAHFPKARVVVRSDGDDDPANREIEELFDVDYREEKRLFSIEHGGAMIARTLEIFLENPTRYLLRMDTDTAVYRRFRFLPEGMGVFGMVQSSKQGCNSIQGGFTGFSKETARTILDSGLLRDMRLKNPAASRSESPYFDRMAQRAYWKGLCSFDWIVGWAATELGLPLISFSEVYCKGLARNAITNDDLKFAVTHPVYFD